MTLFEMIYTMFIGPLKLIFEIVFDVANGFTGNPGLSIVFLSLVMNVLVLPLYRRADAMQEQARNMDEKLRDGVAHIKKTFSGDEKMLILQTYYRQNHYKPTDALKGSISLLLEIPFFIAAYQFLSNLGSLRGISLGPIHDLSAPDEMLVISGLTINILPIIMTGINVISSCIYLKGFPLKTKIQLYGMAFFFLVFLYHSPSGLVFYWTLNNLFSLVKTIFYKLKNPKRVLSVLMAVIGVPLFIYAVGFYQSILLEKKVFLILVAILFEIPIVWGYLKPKTKLSGMVHVSPNRSMFMIASCFLTILVGVLIPSTLIADSPQEFVDIAYFHHPIWYIVRSAIMAAGTFLIWMRVFYWLASSGGKVFFDIFVWILCGIMLIDYMFFGKNLGIISSTLRYENGMLFSRKECLINGGVLVVLAVVLYLVQCKWHRVVSAVLLTASITIGIMSAGHFITIKSSVNKITAADSQTNTVFELSTRGKNVVVIMLDRAMGEYIPYIINEKPELCEQFAGFTYYSNVISFGGYTNFGAPGLLGGYEYTPVEMNRRADEPLVVKHNEAVKVMPVLFANHGYDVTVCDPTYANYQWIPDLSIFNEYPEINTYITKGKFSTPELKQQVIDHNNRNFFCFSIMKTMPLMLQPSIYSLGTYNQPEHYLGQIMQGGSKAKGMSSAFMEPYNVLCNLSDMAKVTDDNKNTFLFLSNDTTHEPMLLQEPEYKPAQYVDNTEYDIKNTQKCTVNGETMKIENEEQMIHYHANMAALLRLGEWFDNLKQKNVYNNTKIILVSDHGRDLKHFDQLLHDASDLLKNVEMYYPLLMVKDFNSTEFTISDEFMTNADVPVLATDGLIEDPENPFTGNPITSVEKKAHDQYIIMSSDWEVGVNNGNTFLPARWARVKDNIWDKENWEFYDENIVLDEYQFPDTHLDER